MRARAAQFLHMETVPVIVVTLTEEKEKEWSLKDNLHQGDWDWDMLADFDEKLLADAGFTSEELDEIFRIEETPEQFDLIKELQKLKIDKIEIQKGDVFDLNGSRAMCGDSTSETDMAKLMNSEKSRPLSL